MPRNLLNVKLPRGVTAGMIGCFQAPLPVDKRRSATEQTALPLPVLIIASPDFHGYEELLMLMQGAGVKVKLALRWNTMQYRLALHFEVKIPVRPGERPVYTEKKLEIVPTEGNKLYYEMAHRFVSEQQPLTVEFLDSMTNNAWRCKFTPSVMKRNKSVHFLMEDKGQKQVKFVPSVETDPAMYAGKHPTMDNDFRDLSRII